MSEFPAPEGPRLEAQRLHPLTILFELVRTFLRFALALAGVLVAQVLGGRSQAGDLVFALVGGGGLLAAVLRYLTVRYAVGDGTLTIRSGALFRKTRTVPLERIQNVDLRRSALHRLLGVVDLRIETAGGAGAEVELSLLSDAAARDLSRLVLPFGPAASGDATPAPAAGPRRTELWRAGNAPLLLMGATQNRLGTVLGAVFGLLYFAQQATGRELSELVRDLARTRLPPAWLTWVEIGVPVALLLAGWIVSIVTTFVRYHGFALARDAEGRLHRVHGLLTRRESVVPLDRVQLVSVEANPPRRWLRRWTAFVETAGSRADLDSGGASLLCPWARWDEVGPVAAQVLPGIDLDDIAWQPVAPIARRRFFVRTLLGPLLLTCAAALSWSGAAFAALPPALALAWWWSRARYRALRYATGGTHLLVRDGVWTRRVTIVPEARIQFLTCSASPFQRLAGLATLSIRTAGASGTTVRIPELQAEDARTLAARLAARVDASGETGTAV